MKPTPDPNEARRMQSMLHEAIDLADAALDLLDDYSGGDSESAHHLRETLDAIRRRIDK